MTGNKNAWRAPLAGLASLAMIATMGVATGTANAADVNVTFDANGGKFAGTNQATYTRTDSNGKLDQSELAQGGAVAAETGFEFTGWYDSPNYGTATKIEPGSAIADGQTVYAHWSKSPIRVEFTTTADTVATDPATGSAMQIVADNDVLSDWQKPEDSSIADGKIVDYWTTDGTDTTVTDSELTGSFWEKLGYGQGTFATLKLTEKLAKAYVYTFKPSSATWTNGYPFESPNSGSDYKAEVKQDESYNDRYSSLPVQYRKDKPEVKVTKWVDEDDKTAWDPSTVYNQNLTLLATESEIAYTVKFLYAKGGDSYKTVSVGENSPVSKPADPTRDGKTFEGWYNAADDKAWDFKDNVTVDGLTLYAKWTNTTATVTFDPGFGQEKAIVKTFKDGDQFALPEAPARAGYEFVGWYSRSVSAEKYAGRTLQVDNNGEDGATGVLYYLEKGEYIELPYTSFTAVYTVADANALEKQEAVVPNSLLLNKDGGYLKGSEQKIFTASSFDQFVKDYQQYKKDKKDAGDLSREEAVKLIKQLKDAQSKLVFNTTKPVYRLYSEAFKRHLVTSSKVEKDFWQANGYKYEGEAFKTVDVQAILDAKTAYGDKDVVSLDNAEKDPTVAGLLTAVHRLYNPSVDRQHLTPQANEIEVLTTTAGWRDEGVAFYAPANGTTPVYRVYIPSTLEHLWTTSANEYDTLGQNPGVYQQEGVDFSL